jgi:hypothetical protein
MQRSQELLLGNIRENWRVETGTNNLGVARCRIMIDTIETRQLADVYCVRVFRCARWDRRVKRLGVGLALAGGAALLVGFGGLGLHELSQSTADLVGALGGGSSVAVGTGTLGLSPKPRARRRRGGEPTVHQALAMPPTLREQATTAEGPWRKCVDNGGGHASCEAC